MTDLSVNVVRGLGRSTIMPASGSSGSSGELVFAASPDHALVTNYTARIRVSGNATVVATQDLGVPTPDWDNQITVDLSPTLSGLSHGTYTVSILTTWASGSADSAEGSTFVI